MSFFRKPILPYLVLLLMMSSGSMQLCTHDHHGSEAPPTLETSLDSSCEGCCDEGHEDSHDELCDSCVCACHGAGILIAVLNGDYEITRGATHQSDVATRLPGHLRRFERPPLRS